MSKIPNERKVTYYIGIGKVVLGFILFISVFFSVVSFIEEPSMNGKQPSFLKQSSEWF